MPESPATEPLTPAVVRRQAFIGQVDLSAGGLVVYTRRTVERDRDVVRLWTVPFGGGRPRLLTHGQGRDTRPRFAPDGRRIAFLRSDGDAPAQVWLLPVDGGEPWRVTDFGRGVVDFDWRPDGRALAVLAEDARSPFQLGEEGDDREPTARVVRRLDWRLDGSGLQLHPAHVHLVERLEAGSAARPRRLTQGDWSAARPRFRRDGAAVAFLADRRADADLEPRAEVLGVPTAGGQEPLPLASFPGPVVRFAVEDDGSLTCLAHTTPAPADADAPGLFRVHDGETTALSDGLDRFVGVFGTDTDLHDWLVDGDDAGTVANVALDGRIVPYRFADGEPAPLVDAALDPVANSLAARGGRTVAVLSLGGAAPELYALEDPARPRRLTTHGGRWLRRHRAPRVEERWVPGPGGPIQAFLVHPRDRAAPAAAVLDVHGGPTGAWAPAPPLEALLLADAGYLVVLPNIRGSYHRGRDWVAALGGDWGGADAADCHAVLDGLVASGEADPARLGCLGLSYGGFAVNWLVATSDRFAAAVSENGVSNQVSAWGNCDVGAVYCSAAGLGDATTADGAAALWRASPLRLVRSITTPLLLLQAEGDRRCPPADNEQLFVALRWLRRPVEYVLYPEESHAFQGHGRPDRRRDRHERVLAWFLRHMPAR